MAINISAKVDFMGEVKINVDGITTIFDNVEELEKYLCNNYREVTLNVKQTVTSVVVEKTIKG